MISIDELNKFQMEWNKGSIISPSFSNVCSQTKYTMTSRACTFDTYGPKNRRTVKPAKLMDTQKLVKLVEKGNLYCAPVDGNKQVMHNFWWDLVQPGKDKVGSAKAIRKQNVADPKKVGTLFDIFSSSEDARDYDEFELDETGHDDACVSVISSES